MGQGKDDGFFEANFEIVEVAAGSVWLDEVALV